MTVRSPRETEDERLLAERAAEWVYVLRTAGETERAEFADWLAESPRHVEEFLAMTALDREIAQLPIKENPRLQAKLKRNTGSVIALRASAASKPAHVARVRVTRSAAGWAAVVIMTIALVIGYRISKGQEYATAIGEQRTIVLADGSQMSMTAHTQARVRFSDRRRDIELLTGEALFKVAKDGSRPFVVHAADAEIRAIGTQFNVLLRPSGTTISVLEGAVSVEGQHGGESTSIREPSATLHAGDEVRVSHGGAMAKRSQSIERAATTWRQRRLVFRADTLSDIAAEFNRYNRAPRLVVEPNAAEEPRYTGVFDADDPASLLAFLREDSQILLEEHGDDLVIRAR